MLTKAIYIEFLEKSNNIAHWTIWSKIPDTVWTKELMLSGLGQSPTS